MCTQGLASGKEIKTDCSVNTTYKGKTYCFGNEQAKTDFMKDADGNLAKAQSRPSIPAKLAPRDGHRSAGRVG
jgi:YHS domain-containing protein